MRRSLTIYISVPLMLLMLVGIEYAQSAYTESVLSEERRERELKFQLARAQLESVIFHDIYLSETIATYIAAHPNSTAEQWAPIAQALYEKADAIRNIGLAPNDVIEYVYPLAGNEAALGYDLRTNPAQYASVEQARDEQLMVLSGPADMVQGGRALIARVPIFRLDSPEEYWGAASVVMDTAVLAEIAGFNDLMEEGLNFALRGLNGKGAEGDVFYGDEELFEQNNPEMMVNLPNGSWVLTYEELRQLPEQMAWYQEHLVRILGAAALLVILAMLGYTDWALTVARRHAREDELTGLTNLRFLGQFTDQLVQRNQKNPTQFAVMYIDLDGFKQINDGYGHKAGDQILIAVANTLRGSVSSSDVAARIGGDEFLLLLTRMRSQEDLDKVAERVRNAIENTTVDFEGTTLSVGASVGSATYPHEGKDLDQLLKTADTKMYTNKRNRKEKARD